MEARILPFLKKKEGIATGGVLIKNRQPDESSDSQTSYIESCVKDLISAVHNRDAKLVEQSLRDIFQELEQEPHSEEGIDAADSE